MGGSTPPTSYCGGIVSPNLANSTLLVSVKTCDQLIKVSVPSNPNRARSTVFWLHQSAGAVPETGTTGVAVAVIVAVGVSVSVAVAVGVDVGVGEAGVAAATRSGGVAVAVLGPTRLLTPRAKSPITTRTEAPTIKLLAFT